MTDRPRFEDRPATPYLAVAGSGSSERELRAFADASFPALFGWLREHAVAPAAAPFMRFFRFTPGGEFAVEVGITTTTVDGRRSHRPPRGASRGAIRRVRPRGRLQG